MGLRVEEAHVAGRDLSLWQRLAVGLIKPPLTVLTRRTWSGFEHVPQTGPVIIVANHISHADTVAVAHFVYDSGRWPQFMIKSSVFKVPVVGYLMTKWTQIPVQRGSADAARALEASLKVLEEGGSVVIYPEGTTTKEPDLWPMRGKTGAARLALATGAPVIPLVTWGAQDIFDPRTKKKRIRPRMPVTLVAGPPVDLSKWAGQAPTSQVLNEMTTEIMNRLREMISEVRGEPAPPIWSPQAAQQEPKVEESS
ncbi:lysophospholipid acyltransferase family protein [Virgisporangium ochraceum]|uniref:1-acyl-sn-glycerol-3-phosphate acyltransferase n=1 Tax=Virgisporangium ochraceum TaxID=65505 RepID=A0A8J4EC55_9ACTN|nr:1-acyl-sn-glycerol-3-phosphate acyltransferase [Virgisporangium ochraceum]